MGILWSYSVLLMVIAVMDDNEAQVKSFTEVKQVICLRLSPAIVMEIHLIFLFRVNRHLYCLNTHKRERDSGQMIPVQDIVNLCFVL